MSCQIAALSELFVTQSALVWSLFGVSPHVSFQIATCSKRFAAYRTAEVLFAGMSSLTNSNVRVDFKMACQMLIPLEGFPAVLASKRPCIAVYLQVAL